MGIYFIDSPGPDSCVEIHMVRHSGINASLVMLLLSPRDAFVVNFDQLSGAELTLKMVVILLFWPFSTLFVDFKCFFMIFLHKNWNQIKERFEIDYNARLTPHTTIS